MSVLPKSEHFLPDRADSNGSEGQESPPLTIRDQNECLFPLNSAAKKKSYTRRNRRPMTPPISIYDLPAFDQLQRDLRLDPTATRRLRNDWLKHFLPDDIPLSPFPAAERVARRGMELFKRCDSAVDGATKLLLRTSAGLLIE